MNDTEKTLMCVENLLIRDPSKVKDVLHTVSKFIEDYEKAVRDSRNQIASNALQWTIGFCLDSKMFNKMKPVEKIAYLIDAMFYLFPHSKPTVNSKIEREVFDLFKECCLFVDPNELYNWISDVKGQLYYDWLKLVLKDEEINSELF